MYSILSLGNIVNAQRDKILNQGNAKWVICCCDRKHLTPLTDIKCQFLKHFLKVDFQSSSPTTESGDMRWLNLAKAFVVIFSGKKKMLFKKCVLVSFLLWSKAMAALERSKIWDVFRSSWNECEKRCYRQVMSSKLLSSICKPSQDHQNPCHQKSTLSAEQWRPPQRALSRDTASKLLS